MSEIPPYVVRAYQPGDEHAILEAFNRIFARIDPIFVPRTLDAWRWQYLENPSGLRIQLCITEQGRVLAQYAGIPQRVLLDGEPTYFSQSVDSMGDPEFRRGLAKVPLFVQAGKAYDEGYGGVGARKDTLMWGLPVPVAWRIGKKQLKYEYMRTIGKLVAPTGALRRGVTGVSADVQIEERVDFPAELDAFFASAARERAGIAVRDAAQMNWRFARHPQHRYRIALARRAGAIAGMAVYSRGSFDLHEDGLVCDWLVPAGDERAAHALRAWLAERASADGCEQLVALFPDTAPEWLAFQNAGFKVRKTRYFLVAWSFSRRHNLRWLWQNWYYTLGDTDLC